MDRANASQYIRPSNFFAQILCLTWKIVVSNIFRNLSFYVSLIMSLAIITICLFWPTTAYEVIIGDDDKYIPEMTFQAAPMRNYTLVSGFMNPNQWSVEKSKNLASTNLFDAEYCGNEESCEKQIIARSMPAANSDIYLINKNNVFYAVYQSSKSADDTNLLLRIPFHHTYNPNKLIWVLMPFKLYLDQYVMKILNLNSSNIRYGIKYARTSKDGNKAIVNPLTQFSAGVMGAHAFLGLTVMIIHMSSAIVFDKEIEMRSLMSIMGMRRMPYLISFMLIYIVVIIVLAFYGTIIIVLEPKLINVSIRMFRTYVLIYLNYSAVGLLIMAQGLLMTTFTRSVRIITFIVLLVQCLQMIVGMTVLKFHLEESRKSKETKTDINWINYIFPVIAFFNTQIELFTETSVTGLEPSPGAKIWFLLVMTLITLVIAIYLDFVIDTGTGHTYPWYFPFSWVQRLISKNARNRMSSYCARDYRDDGEGINSYFLEQVNESLVRVKLVDIEKRFTRTVCCNVTEVRAVQNLTIDLQEGMITAILGHNGAGKTTTFSMLVGLIHSTGGSMNIYGLNPDDPWDKSILNQMMSICMQKDILIQNMTSIEHMRLFGVIKGLSKTEIEKQADQLFTVLEMKKETNKKIKILSGGQLRKLCVAIALLGNPKIVILDEPTSGVDPISRRSIWNALKAYKNDRVLILSTHYMDEADILADWKAIMVKGQVVCYGTSMFLKKKFNLGYVLNCSIKSEQVDTSNLLQMIKDNAPSSEFQKRYGMEVTFKVYDQEIVKLCQYMSSQEGMNKLSSLGVLDYGISVTKLEEIFLKLGEVEVDDPDHQNDNIEHVLEENLIQIIKVSSKVSHNEEINLKQSEKTIVSHTKNPYLIGFYQFWTLIRLNILLSLRSPIFATLRTVGPVTASALGALLFWFESSRAPKFDATGLNLSLVSSPWPPYLVYSFKFESDLSSRAEFFLDLVCIRRMYGHRVLIANESDTATDLQGSTNIQINSWNPTQGYNLNFLYIVTYKGSLYNMFLFQTLLQNCLINRLKGIDLNNYIQYYVIADTWNIKWVDSAHPSFMMLSAFVYLIALSVAFNLMNPVISGDVVRDRILGNLAQMNLYGLKYMSYWGSHFVLHFFHYIAIMCVIIIFMCFVENYIFCELEYACTFIILYIFATVDTILAIYCISMAFSDMVAAEISLSFSIMIPMFLMSVLVFCPLHIMNVMHIIFLAFFPFLNPWITLMLIDFKTRQQRHFLYDRFNVDYGMNMQQLINYKPVRNSMIIHSAHIIFLTIFFVSYNWYIYSFKRTSQSSTLFNLLRKKRSDDKTSTSISVTMEGFAKGANVDLEQNRGLVDEIIEGEVWDGNISAAVGDLTKIFYTVKTNIPRKVETTIALSNVNLVINKGEVFGLLGPSGAGKTTAMSCISQLLLPSSGKIIVYDRSNKKFIPASEALTSNLIGLCPQNNPIWPNLTVREHLLLYAALRSIPRRHRNSHTSNLIKLVHLKKYTHSLSESLSGGCKRRLSMAISFTGFPDLILLDEPSCGVDPKSRRNLWDTISSAIHNTDKGAVITSQFMEECEALCNRLAIIVNGRIMCIGSPQELKSKFGRGISVDIKIIPGIDGDATFRIKSDLTQYLLELYPRLLTVENFGERLTYRIPKSPDINFGSVFKVIHEAKSKFDIEDYAVSQPTLEQVYFDFAKYQTKDDLRYDVQVHVK